jgi:hypothetical protein
MKKRFIDYFIAAIIGILLGYIICLLSKNGIEVLFLDKHGKVDMSIVWTAIGAISAVIVTLGLGLFTIRQNSVTEKEKGKLVLLESGFFKLHGEPTLKNDKLILFLVNIKPTVIVSIDNIELTINQHNISMQIQGTYFQDFGKGNGVNIESINSITAGTFISDTEYNFRFSFDMVSENNLKSKMIILFHATYDIDNKLHVDKCEYEKRLVKL